jgi:hypothetical protein
VLPGLTRERELKLTALYQLWAADRQDGTYPAGQARVPLPATGATVGVMGTHCPLPLVSVHPVTLWAPHCYKLQPCFKRYYGSVSFLAEFLVCQTKQGSDHEPLEACQGSSGHPKLWVVEHVVLTVVELTVGRVGLCSAYPACCYWYQTGGTRSGQDAPGYCAMPLQHYHLGTDCCTVQPAPDHVLAHAVGGY